MSSFDSTKRLLSELLGEISKRGYFDLGELSGVADSFMPVCVPRQSLPLPDLRV